MARSVDERRREILQIVAEEGSQHASRLAERLGVSAVTIRRDLEQLAQAGELTRRHGVVEPKRSVPAEAPPRTIGLVLPHAGYYYDGIIGGARSAAAKQGAKLILGVSDYDSEREQYQVERLVEQHIDGILVAPTSSYATGELSPAQEDWLSRVDTKMVITERVPSPTGPAAFIDSVSAAHEAGAAIALRHLYDLGHRNIGFLAIAGPNVPRVRNGFDSALACLGLTAGPHLNEGRPGSDDSQEALLKAVKTGTTAFLIHNDQLAVRALMWLDQAGVEVPDDVSVVGYDDVIAGVASTPLTALAPPKFDVGAHAVNRLIQLINAGHDTIPNTEHLQLMPHIHVRESTSRVR